MFPLLLAWLVSDLDTALNAVLDHPDMAGAVVGAYVREVGGEVVYERNADLRLVPASNQKLLSCAYVLARMPLDQRFRTRIWVEEDAVIVDTEGDPTLTHAQLTEARERLGLDGKRLVRVRQLYRPHIPPTWEYDDLPHRYAAPVTAFTVDRGAFELWAEPGRLFFLPEDYGVQAKFFSAPGNARVEYIPHLRTALVRGQWPSERTRLDTLALWEPDRAAARILGEGFEPVREVPLREPDHVIESPPLIEIVRDCLVRSDNHYAEHLLLQAALASGPLGDNEYATAGRRFREFLTGEVGIPVSAILPIDGSGMSRQNLVTARGIGHLLGWIDQQPWGQAYRDSLAAPGRGTLASRLAGSSFVGKTGTLSRVSALSGYVTGADGKRYLMSLVMNHYAATAAQARARQDEFVRTLERGTWSYYQVWTDWDRAHRPPQQFHGASRDRIHGPRADGRLVVPGLDHRDEPADAWASW